MCTTTSNALFKSNKHLIPSILNSKYLHCSPGSDKSYRSLDEFDSASQIGMNMLEPVHSGRIIEHNKTFRSTDYINTVFGLGSLHSEMLLICILQGSRIIEDKVFVCF